MTSKREEIICFKCREKISFMKNNRFVFEVYGNVNYIFKCECGASYLIKVNIKRLVPKL